MEIDYTQLRQKMVDSQIRTVDVTKLSVLNAFLAVERQLFVPEKWRGASYADGRVMVAAQKSSSPARFMMPPSAQAKLLQLANISEDDFILDVGVMTGYSSALLACLGSAVVALECDAELLEVAESLFAQQKYENITTVQGDLQQGYTAQAPYDVIMIEGGVDFIPESLFAQLREGGRLVAVEGRGGAAIAYLFEREDGVISRYQGFNLALDALPGFVRKEVFTF